LGERRPGQILAVDSVVWRVVNVHDGETRTALDDTNTQRRIRLQGIDALNWGSRSGRLPSRRRPIWCSASS